LLPAEEAQEGLSEGGEEHVEIKDDEVSGEAQDIKVAPDPFMPSAAEVEEHRVTHWPYRSWCRECVEGKALGEHRSHRCAHGSRVAVVGIDYFFMTFVESWHVRTYRISPSTMKGKPT
jgi:hypothetical protein